MGVPQSGHGPSFLLMNTLPRTTPFSPEILKPRRRQLSVSHRVLDIAMAEIHLQSPGVVAPVASA